MVATALWQVSLLLRTNLARSLPPAKTQIYSDSIGFHYKQIPTGRFFGICYTALRFSITECWHRRSRGVSALVSMHRHSFLTRSPFSLPPANRFLRLLGAVVCAAVLAGCASTGGQQRSASAVEEDPYEMEWTPNNNDPIGILVSQRLKRSKPNATAKTSNPFVSEAMSHIGIRYRFGGNSPDTGFDCSGLVSYVAERSLGLKLPRNAADIARHSEAIDKNQLQAGDLVFFNTLGRRYSHVGIYMGNNRFVHSPSAGGAVRVESMDMTYWAKRYNGARRLASNMVAGSTHNRLN